MSDFCYNDLYKDKILNLLMHDKITFAEAAERLNVSEKEIDEMLDGFHPFLILE